MNDAIRLDFLGAAVIALGITFLPLTVTALAAAPASSACTAAEYRQLDFWIGDWDTFETEAPDSPSIARARIETIAGGCALRELYEQTDGLIGDSILSYDPVLKHWQQTWVTNRGSLMVLVGNFKDGVLVLEGESHMQDGKSVMQRISWEAQENGVREWAVMSKDKGVTWMPAFDVLFRKREGTHRAQSSE